MAQKVEFLQGKGLTDTEIQQALQEAQNPSSAIQAPAPAAPPAYARPAPQQQTTQQPYYGFQSAFVAPPEPPKRDWRDIFVSAREASARRAGRS